MRSARHGGEPPEGRAAACETDADCPIVVGECAEPPTCNLVSCGADGFCVESTCV